MSRDYFDYSDLSSENGTGENGLVPSDISLDSILEEYRRIDPAEYPFELDRILEEETGETLDTQVPTEHPAVQALFDEADEPVERTEMQKEPEPPAEVSEPGSLPDIPLWEPAESAGAEPAEIIEEDDEFFRIQDETEEIQVDEPVGDAVSVFEEPASEEAAEEHRVPLRQRFQKKFSSFHHASAEKEAVSSGVRLSEAEEEYTELSPKKAAKYYAVRVKSLRMRSLAAAVVCLLLCWITAAYGHGWNLPGTLEESPARAVTLCLVSLLAVMLLGTDILSAGFVTILHGRPGAGAMLLVSCLLSLFDCAAVLLGGRFHGLPPVVLPALGLLFALTAGWNSCLGYRTTFLSQFYAGNSETVFSFLNETDGVRRTAHAAGSPAGFIRRAEQTNGGEELSTACFLPFLLLALVLSLLASIISRQPGSFLHLFSMMAGMACSFSWLLTFPVLFRKTAFHLRSKGVALAGWTGTVDIGRRKEILLNDGDLFPAGTVEITGLRILDKTKADRITACLGSVLHAAGAGTADVFLELMARNGLDLLPVDDLEIGDGGMKAVIESVPVRVGTSGYMYLSGVKIPDKMLTDMTVYIALDEMLAGAFLLRYKPSGSVQRSIQRLRRLHKTPVFGMRDFNLDAQSVSRLFGVPTDGFRFPDLPERFEITDNAVISDGDVSAVSVSGDMPVYIDLVESASRLYMFCTANHFISAASSIIGIIWIFISFLNGDAGLVSTSDAMVYMLFWLLPLEGFKALTSK